jgi:Xaa-Pro aminopeptidase
MKSQNFSAYFLPHNDYHNVNSNQSEYLGKHDHRVEFISGFKGSNSQILITESEALLWTDGRYWIAVIFN